MPVVRTAVTAALQLTTRGGLVSSSLTCRRVGLSEFWPGTGHAPGSLQAEFAAPCSCFCQGGVLLLFLSRLSGVRRS
jgi:hypothetical protein